MGESWPYIYLPSSSSFVPNLNPWILSLSSTQLRISCTDSKSLDQGLSPVVLHSDHLENRPLTHLIHLSLYEDWGLIIMTISPSIVSSMAATCPPITCFIPPVTLSQKGLCTEYFYFFKLTGVVFMQLFSYPLIHSFILLLITHLIFIGYLQHAGWQKFKQALPNLF